MYGNKEETVHVESVLWDAAREIPLVVLADSKGKSCCFPLSPSEASRVLIALAGDWDPGPSPEKTLHTLLTQTGSRSESVLLYAASLNRFYPMLIYRRGMRTQRAELTPGDALCFSLRYNVPLRVEGSVWESLVRKAPYVHAGEVGADLDEVAS